MKIFKNDSVLKNCAAGFAVMGAGAGTAYVSLFTDRGKEYAKDYIGDQGPGAVTGTGLAMMFAGANMVIDSGIFGKIGRYFKGYSLRNDAILATHAITTGVGTAIGAFTAKTYMPKSKLPCSPETLLYAGAGGLALAAVAGLYLYKTSDAVKSPFAPAPGVGGLEREKISLEANNQASKLHIDYPMVCQLGTAKMRYSSMGAALAASLIKTDRRSELKVEGKPAEFIREIIEKSLSDSNADGNLKPEFAIGVLNPSTGALVTRDSFDTGLRTKIEELLDFKFGIGIAAAQRTPLQTSFREALLATGEKTIEHPAVLGMTADFISMQLGDCRQRIITENATAAAAPAARLRRHVI